MDVVAVEEGLGDVFQVGNVVSDDEVGVGVRCLSIFKRSDNLYNIRTVITNVDVLIVLWIHV